MHECEWIIIWCDSLPASMPNAEWIKYKYIRGWSDMICLECLAHRIFFFSFATCISCVFVCSKQMVGCGWSIHRSQRYNEINSKQFLLLLQIFCRCGWCCSCSCRALACLLAVFSRFSFATRCFYSIIYYILSKIDAFYFAKRIFSAGMLCILCLMYMRYVRRDLATRKKYSKW